jgi:hypothetical protein
MGPLSKEGEGQFPYPRDEVFDAVLQAIANTKGMKLKESDRATGQIVAKTSVSLASWGETIRLEVAERGPQSAVVRMASTLKAQLVDWGKNRRNIEKLMAEVTTVLERR